MNGIVLLSIPPGRDVPGFILAAVPVRFVAERIAWAFGQPLSRRFDWHREAERLCALVV